MQEHALLALRAVVNKDRTLTETLMKDDRLPMRERVWVVSELGEARIQQQLQELARHHAPVTAATALYALYVASARHGVAAARPTETGVFGCVSKALQTLDGKK